MRIAAFYGIGLFSGSSDEEGWKTCITSEPVDGTMESIVSDDREHMYTAEHIVSREARDAHIERVGFFAHRVTTREDAVAEYFADRKFKRRRNT